MCAALPICAGTHRCGWLILKYQEKHSGWNQTFSAHRDYYLPTGFVDASRAPPWELISRTRCPEKSRWQKTWQTDSQPLTPSINTTGRSLLQLSLRGGTGSCCCCCARGREQGATALAHHAKQPQTAFPESVQTRAVGKHKVPFWCGLEKGAKYSLRKA